MGMELANEAISHWWHPQDQRDVSRRLCIHWVSCDSEAFDPLLPGWSPENPVIKWRFAVDFTQKAARRCNSSEQHASVSTAHSHSPGTVTPVLMPMLKPPMPVSAAGRSSGFRLTAMSFWYPICHHWNPPVVSPWMTCPLPGRFHPSWRGTWVNPVLLGIEILRAGDSSPSGSGLL